jgi:hypothetical protein|tara:strand:+ start:636 stop:1028 length:393 start_codon:yes stop_codon:yes gene_type:complete
LRSQSKRKKIRKRRLKRKSHKFQRRRRNNSKSQSKTRLRRLPLASKTISNLRSYQSVFSSQARNVVNTLVHQRMKTTPAIVMTQFSKTRETTKRKQLLLRNQKLKSQSKNRRNKKRWSFRRPQRRKRLNQ